MCGEVFKRYALNAPTAWIFDANNMLYGTLFRLWAGPTRSRRPGHVRGDFFYGSMKPRTQAALDLVLFALFFLPGVVALTWSGWDLLSANLLAHGTSMGPSMPTSRSRVPPRSSS